MKAEIRNCDLDFEKKGLEYECHILLGHGILI